MKWFRTDENGVKLYAPQLVKENGQYVKPSPALLESLGYRPEPDEVEQGPVAEGVFTHGEPRFTHGGLETAILSGLQALDNSIVMQLAGEDNAAEDVSFVQCFYGHQRSHVEAAKKALLLNLGSEPKFGEWIFTEAQVDGEREFEWLKDYGVRYEFVNIPDESKWMFLKWPLWNLGVRKASNGKLAFADADVVFCSRGWAAKVSKALGEFDVVSLSRKCYYAEQSFRDGDAELGAYKGLLDTAGASERGHAGFTFGFTGKFLSEFGGFGCSVQKHGDVASWSRAREIAKAKGFKAGCAEGVCCHVSHGFISDRRYEESKEVFRKIDERQESFIVYGPDDVLPKWNEGNPRCDEVRSEFAFVYFDQFCRKEGPIVLDRRFSLDRVRAAVQKKIDDSVEDGTNFVRPMVQDADPADVEGVAVVQCLFGTDEEQVAAAKKAIGLLAASGQRPSEWVFVEAQYDEKLAQMKGFCESHGIRYLFKKATCESDGIFLKNALWNIGARATTAQKLVFVDADVAFSNAGWLKEISRKLDDFKVVQPFAEIWWSEELADDGERRYFSANFRKSFANALKNNRHADIRIHAPGYALSMRRSFFDSIVGIDVLPSNGSDAWFWLKHLPPQVVMKSSLELPLLGGDYSYELEPGDISYSDNIAFHVRHGSLSGRKYHETLIFNQKFCNRVNDTVEYDVSQPDFLPKFKKTKVAQAHQACVLRCRSTDDSVDDIFDEEKFKAYDHISEGNKVVFLTVLNNDSGREAMSHSVARIHKFLIDKYCLDPHEYWCLTNEKIDGVNTIPLKLDANREIIGWNAQYELFRNLFPGHPVMTLDFDCVPTRPFTLHDVPDKYFSMMYQTSNSLEKVPSVIFNCGSMFFKGDFGFIFDEYRRTLGGVPASMYFTTVQDFVAYQALSRGIGVNSILNVADVFLLKINHPSYRKSYFEAKKHTFIHYLGDIKPWNTSKLKQLGLRYLVPSEFLTFDGDF